MFTLENHSGFLSCTDLWTISTEKAQFKHNTLCVISTERGNCLTPHRAIHTDGDCGFLQGKCMFPGCVNSRDDSFNSVHSNQGFSDAQQSVASSRLI